MKQVKVRYYSLYTIITDRYEESFLLQENATLDCLIKAAVAKYGPALEQKIFTSAGILQRTCWFLINGKRVTTSPCQTQLLAGDEVILTLPMLMGG